MAEGAPVSLSKSYFDKLVDGEASSPATATLSKGEWLRMSHSVAKRLVFANWVGKNHLFR